MSCFRLFVNAIIYISGLCYLIASVDESVFKNIFKTYPDFVILCILSFGNIFTGAMGCIYRPFDDDDVKCYIKTKRTILFITGVYNCVVTIMFMRYDIFFVTFCIFLSSFIETFFDKQLNTPLNTNIHYDENKIDENSSQKHVILVNNCGDIEIGISAEK